MNNEMVQVVDIIRRGQQGPFLSHAVNTMFPGELETQEQEWV